MQTIGGYHGKIKHKYNRPNHVLSIMRKENETGKRQGVESKRFHSNGLPGMRFAV